MEIITVCEKNLSCLQKFIDNLGESAISFRYFKRRGIEAIYNHLTTLLLLENDDTPIGYGHLEREGDENWLGLCILPNYKGQGYGKIMMNKLLSQAKLLGLTSVSLTVDNGNYNAIHLYNSFGFKKIVEKDTYFKFCLDIR